MWWNDRRIDYYDEPWGGNDELHEDGCLGMVLWFVVAGAVCLLLGSCRTKYVSVPERHEVVVTRHDTVALRDSVFERDSVYIVRSGDTIATYRTRYRYVDRWRERVVYKDSVRTDSVCVPLPVVTNKVRWQDKAAYVGVGFALCVVLGLICVIIIWRLRARSMI